MQPNLERTTMTITDAVVESREQPMTLVEKLERKKASLGHNGMPSQFWIGFGIDTAIDIVKQHQAESDWVSVDERLPEREYCEYLVWVGYPDIATYSKLGWELPSDAVVTHWCELPQPPSKVQA